MKRVVIISRLTRHTYISVSLEASGCSRRGGKKHVADILKPPPPCLEWEVWTGIWRRTKFVFWLRDHRERRSSSSGIKSVSSDPEVLDGAVMVGDLPPDPDRQLLDCWRRRLCLMFGSCWFWITYLTWLTWGVRGTMTSLRGLSCLTQSELCWFLINCLQEFCFSHSDLFNAFKQFSLFRNSCVVSLRADVTSRFLVSLVTASGSSQGDESLWKSLGGPLSACCRSTVPSASQRLL